LRISTAAQTRRRENRASLQLVLRKVFFVPSCLRAFVA
jgi:hypothetical protein